jgi:hypothetical protein
MNGYLSYTLAALAVIGAASGYLLGTIDAGTAISMAWGGLAVFGIRRAVAKNGTGQ